MRVFKRRSVAVLVLTAFLLASLVPGTLASTHKTSADDETIGMVMDALLVRPIGVIGQAAGVLIFVVSLPFTALGGNVREAAEKLVIEPARFTWDRPLGHFEDYE